MSEKQFFICQLLLITAIVAGLAAYVFRPLREVIYVEESLYSDRSDVVEFVESGRRMKADFEGKVGDKFKVQSWMK